MAIEAAQGVAADKAQSIGAMTCAGIVERAIAVLANEPFPSERVQRLDTIDAVGEEAEKERERLDAEFYA